MTETETAGALSFPPSHLIPKTHHSLHFLERDEGQRACEISLSDASNQLKDCSKYANRQEIKICGWGVQPCAQTRTRAQTDRNLLSCDSRGLNYGGIS